MKKEKDIVFKPPQLIALGESHHGKHLESISDFLHKEKDIDWIFNELSVSYQDSVNKYMFVQTIDEKFQRFFDNAGREGKDVQRTNLFLLDFAREKEIPVICVDSSKVKTDKYSRKSNIGHWFLNGESRDEDMFNTIVSTINLGEKGVLVCGSAHLVRDIHHRTKKFTLGKLLKDKYDEGFSYIILD